MARYNGGIQGSGTDTVDQLTLKQLQHNAYLVSSYDFMTLAKFLNLSLEDKRM